MVKSYRLVIPLLVMLVMGLLSGLQAQTHPPAPQPNHFYRRGTGRRYRLQ